MRSRRRRNARYGDQKRSRRSFGRGGNRRCRNDTDKPDNARESKDDATANIDGSDPDAISKKTRNADTGNLARCPYHIERGENSTANGIRYSSLHNGAVGHRSC